MAYETHQIRGERKVSTWQLIVDLANRQLGLFATWQTNGQLSQRVIDNYLRTKRLHRIHQGVYAVGYPKLTREREWMAAVLAAGPGAALCSHSAAYAWGVRRYDVSTIHVVAPTQRRGGRGRTMHTSSKLGHSVVLVNRGVPMVVIERLLIELAADLSVHELVNVMHEGAHIRRFRPDRLEREMARDPSRRGHAKLAQALAAYRAGSRGAESGLEVRAHALVDRMGWPKPLVNVPFDLGDGKRKLAPDLRWPDRQLVVEVDGGGHARPTSKREDERRDLRWEAIGYTVVRVTENDLAGQGARAARKIERALGSL